MCPGPLLLGVEPAVRPGETDTRTPVALPRRRPGLLREVLLIAGLFALYRVVRLAITGQDALAMANAMDVWRLERLLALPDEEVLQDWALQWPAALRASNWYYVGVHFPLTAAFLAWGWLRRPPAEYRWARRLLTVITGLALVGHVAMPLAPPRMLPHLGFLDTMAVFGPSAYDGSAATVANQFAAMPSLHVGWALVIALVVIRTARSPWRWVTVVHPAATVAVVVLTANHYWVDAIAAALLLVIAWAVTPRPAAPAPVTAAWRRRPGWAQRPTVPIHVMPAPVVPTDTMPTDTVPTDTVPIQVMPAHTVGGPPPQRPVSD